MELKDIQKLMDQFEDSNVRELKIDDGDFHLYLSKNKKNNAVSVNKENTNPSTETTPAKTVREKQTPTTENDAAIKAPIVGVVYLQAKPDQPPYVKVGDHIKAGDTVCVIEAMKMMTEVKSKITGTVTAINVDNEDLVEVDQPLISVKEN